MELQTRVFRGSALKVIIIFLMAGVISPVICKGQEDSLKSRKNFKNTVKFNLTNPMLFSPKYNVIGYERVVNDHQTFTISGGRFALGNFVSFSDSVSLSDQYNDKGFNFSVDYRFYLKKENKYNAPRGVFIGPYYSYNHFKRTLAWDINTSTMDGNITTGFDLTANLIGAQMGYQFILWNRVTLDMILMGPGLWFFNLKSEFETTLDPDDEALVLEKLNEMLKNKFPGSDYIFTGGNLEAKKTTSSATMGLRYLINIGFRF